MRLLFLTETIPYPLDSGGRIKTYNTLRILSSEHEVHCHALLREPERLRFATELNVVSSSVTLHVLPRSHVHEIRSAVRGQFTGSPFLVQRHFHCQVFDRIRVSCQRHSFDAVYCDHLSMLEYGRRLNLPVVLDAHNVEFEIIKRQSATLGWTPWRFAAEREWRCLERYERRWYPECRLIYTVSDVDSKVIRSLAGERVPVVEVPIAIEAQRLPRNAVVAEPRILFVGGMHWPPNADAVAHFVREIFPAVKRAVPEATLTVVGRNQERVARHVGATPGVEFVGHVDDVERYFRSSRVMVVPIRAGSGMRVKILDSLGRGLPTVATTLGCEGIDVVPGEHLLVADDAPAFASAVVRLLQEDALARRLSEAGRWLVLQSYDVGVIRARVLQALSDTMVTIHRRVEGSPRRSNDFILPH